MANRGRCGSRVLWASVAGLLLSGLACTEFSHFGQVSDREGTFPVNDVSIFQQQNDGSWREIGKTDGKGKWNILKAQIKGGGRIKMQKPGYHTLVMSESEFLQQNNIMFQASDDHYYQGGTDAAWDVRN